MNETLESDGPDPARGWMARSAAAWLLLVVVSLGLFLANARSLPLMDPDESRCALIVAGMLRGQGWLVPHLEGKAYLEKPAPFFWLAAAGQRLTGSVELGGRGVAALAALAAVLIAAAVARSLAGEAAGLLAGLILATSGEFTFLARFYRMDAPFVAMMWAALWWFWRYERRAMAGPLTRSARRARWIGFYAFAAAATLMKGPVGLGLPGLIVLVYLLLARRPRRILEFLNVPGMLVFLLLAAPWYLAVELRQPVFLRHFFVGENLERFAGGTHGHHWSGLVYLPILLAGLLPWTIYLPGAILRTWPRRRRRDGDQAGPGPHSTAAAGGNPWLGPLLLWSAALVPLVLFSFSGTKLAHYIAPCFPPLAVLIAVTIARWIRSGRPDPLYRRGAWSMAAMVPVLAVLAAGGQGYLRALNGWVAVPLGLVAACVAGMAIAIRRDRRGLFVAWAMAGTLVVLGQLIFGFLPALYGRRSLRQFGAIVARDGSPDAQLIYWDDRRHSFPLYAGRLGGRRIELTDRQQEQVDAIGPAAEAERDQATEAERDGAIERFKLQNLADLMNSPAQVFCLVSDADRLKALRQACPDRVYVLARDQDGFALVTNTPPP